MKNTICSILSTILIIMSLIILLNLRNYTLLIVIVHFVNPLTLGLFFVAVWGTYTSVKWIKQGLAHKRRGILFCISSSVYLALYLTAWIIIAVKPSWVHYTVV